MENQEKTNKYKTGRQRPEKRQNQAKLHRKSSKLKVKTIPAIITALSLLTPQSTSLIPIQENFKVHAFTLDKLSFDALETTLYFIYENTPSQPRLEAYKINYDTDTNSWLPIVANIQSNHIFYDTIPKSFIYLKSDRLVYLYRQKRSNVGDDVDYLAVEVFDVRKNKDGLESVEKKLDVKLPDSIKNLGNGFDSAELVSLEYKTTQPYYLQDNHFFIISKIFHSFILVS